jgi:hypothetical protein
VRALLEKISGVPMTPQADGAELADGMRALAAVP